MNSEMKRKGFLYSAVMTAMILSGHSTQAMAAITVDNTQINQPRITTVASNVTLVDINAPSSGGLSHNIFSDFNVGKQGMVLNNSLQNNTSQLAGLVKANGKLNGKTASIILNEITGGKSSNLQGMIEVAGEKAQVIVANPAGIVCSGCGFINTQRSTLTTGKPQVTNGVLSAFNVNGGKVEIKGAGFKDPASAYTDIITDMLSVSAGLKGQNLRIITGRNTVDNATLSIKKTGKNSGWFSKKVAVDITSLGGIQADTIMMVVTEEGFGVKNAGEVKTTLRDITLTGSGYLKNNGIVNAAGNLFVATSGNIENHGIIKTGKNQIFSTNGNNFENHGEINSGDKINIQSGKLVNRASIKSAGNMVINTYNKSLENGVYIKPAEIKSGGSLTLSAANIDNINDAIISSKNNAVIQTGHINNQKAKIISEGSLQVKANSLSNFMGGLYSTDDMRLDIDEITMNSSGITSESDLSINSRWVDSRMGAVQATGKATINATESYANSSGVIAVGELDLTTKTLKNYAGLMVANRDMTITAQDIDNRYMSLYSPTFGLWIDNLGVDGGIISNGNLTINAKKLNNLQGRAVSQGDMLISADYVDNTYGKISANQNIRLDVDHIKNQNGTIRANEDLRLFTAKITGTSGEIQANNDIELNVNSHFTNHHDIKAGQDIKINVDGSFNNSNSVKSGNNIDINANHIGNYLFKTLYAGNVLRLNTSGTLFNFGRIDAGNNVETHQDFYLGF